MTDIVDLSNDDLIPTPQRGKRKRSEPASHYTYYCARCKSTLQSNSSVYFLPFCGCLYCGPCVLKQIVGVLNSEGPLGRAAVDLILINKGDEMKPPALSINLFKCRKRGHPPLAGAIECYGTACYICTGEDSSSPKCIYLPYAWVVLLGLIWMYEEHQPSDQLGCPLRMNNFRSRLMPLELPQVF
ncbi:hypothetical protein P154DRAFT_528512 [Amniculicola lignicola CBS 123094]|uniref:Uncharacterized protein n=1 Tax=Amniculicola lignicola CBS 123094 TaxID=1392246 RepID=A0A6A5X4J0_9PLEO|nr:hypothetical protein P154DRAFT_528512 [Amniculicola lignicola CBS 123094]